MKTFGKKFLSVLLAAAALIMFTAAFAEGKTEPRGDISKQTSPGGAVGMPNPVKDVTDDDEFEDRLGIDIDTDELKDLKPVMQIIGDKVGQISFVLENVNAEPVKWTFRFTKDKELGESPQAFSGVYDSKMSEPAVTEVPLDDKKTVSIKYIRANTEKYDLYFWKIGDVYCSLSVNGDFSQMQYAAVMDRLLEACEDD